MTGGVFASALDANGRTQTPAGQTLREAGTLSTSATGIILSLDSTSQIDATDNGTPLVVNTAGTSANAGTLRTTGTAVFTLQGSGLLDSGGVVLGTGPTLNLNVDTFGGAVYSQGALYQQLDGSTVPVNGLVMIRGQLAACSPARRCCSVACRRARTVRPCGAPSTTAARSKPPARWAAAPPSPAAG